MVDESRFPKNQQRILDALRDAAASLRMREQLILIGGLARHAAGDPALPGDIDILIQTDLCKKYWEFVEILDRHGVRSLWNVPKAPSWWRPWKNETQHGLAFWIEEASSQNDKPNRLDVVMLASDLAAIPQSEDWIIRGKGHNGLVDQMKTGDKSLSAAEFSNELGLYYRLRS